MFDFLNIHFCKGKIYISGVRICECIRMRAYKNISYKRWWWYSTQQVLMQMLSTALVDRVKTDNNRKKQRERERENVRILNEIETSNYSVSVRCTTNCIITCSVCEMAKLIKTQNDTEQPTNMNRAYNRKICKVLYQQWFSINKKLRRIKNEWKKMWSSNNRSNSMRWQAQSLFLHLIPVHGHRSCTEFHDTSIALQMYSKSSSLVRTCACEWNCSFISMASANSHTMKHTMDSRTSYEFNILTMELFTHFQIDSPEKKLNVMTFWIAAE